MASINDLQQELNRQGKQLKLKINDNHSTMLSVRWEPDCTRVSMHRIFLNAPLNVMQELSCYILEEKKEIPRVKAYIEEQTQDLDYSAQLDRKKLYCQGDIYNLQSVFDNLNKEYFQNQLNLSITWFGKVGQKNRSRVTFGLYYDPLKLIKIHRLLDSPLFPDYMISYVVYHEMLHNVCPSYVDERGINQVHNKEFKERERKFEHYRLAQSWIKEHQEYFFAER